MLRPVAADWIGVGLVAVFDQLKKRFFWQPGLKEFLAPMHVANSFDLGIEHFSKGIDNTRIDVVLSPKFMHHTHLWIRQELSDYTAGRKSGTRAGSDGSDLANIKDAYTGMMVVAVDLAKKKSRPDLIPLLQFSVVKFLLQVTTEEIERLQSQMQQSREANKAACQWTGGRDPRTSGGPLQGRLRISIPGNSQAVSRDSETGGDEPL